MKVGEMFANNEEVMLNMQKLKTSMSMLKKNGIYLTLHGVGTR